MRIYLITPRNPESFWTYDHILPVLGRRCIFPNLSMPTLAGLTPPEHEVVLCDENVEEIDFEFAADVVGVTGYQVHAPRVTAIVDEFRRRGRFVVVGGPWASLCPEELAGRCDVVFAGEAEETWPRFLRDRAAGRWEPLYQPAALPDLSDSPMPRYDLLPVERYHALTVQFARGCPYDCEFCDIIVVYGRRPRAKRVEQVIAEIDACHRLGAKQIFLVDDNFVGNRRLAKDLLRALAAWGAARDYPVHFQAEVTLNAGEDAELLALFRAARFTTIFIGIESPRRDSLLEAKKTQNLRGDMVETVHRFQTHGMQVQAGMIVGFDHDDPRIFEEQLRFMDEARIPVSMTGMLQAMPRTPLHARVAAEGRLIGESSGDAFVFSNVLPAGMTRVDLYRGYRKLIAGLYDYGSFHRRAMAFLLNRGDRVRRRDRRVSAAEVWLFARILWSTVVRASPRRAWFTLRLLAATLLQRPSVFHDAVALALVHRAFHGYVTGLCRHLDRAIGEMAEPSGP
jgi:radical SAM superfamily enzyme YgiQ (UPF0313 family)